MKSFIMIALLFIGIAFGQVDSSDEAMFGLRWGMSPQEISSIGVKLEKVNVQSNLHIYKTNSLPKNLSNIEFYLLVFDEDKILAKLSATMVIITGDPMGRIGKNNFEELNNILKIKYKVTNNICIVGRKLYDDYDEFYQCLRYEGCGFWDVFYEGANKNIHLALKGVGRGTGYIVLNCEGSVQWEQAKNKQKGLQLQFNNDAL